MDVSAGMTHTTAVLCFYSCSIRGGKPNHTHTWMQSLNPSTSAKPVMTTLQNLLLLVNMDIFQMMLHFSLFTVN